MKYYEGREATYRKIEETGLQNWDELSNPHWSLTDSNIFRELESGLLSSLIAQNRSLLNVLEIGCGTGSLSIDLAERGLNCTGIDVSETAIRIANKRAAERGPHVAFEVGDICQAPPIGKFDLIIDEHCLHCLAYGPERESALRNICGALASTGAFVIETMVSDVGMVFGANFQLDEDGILWNVSDTAKPAPWERRNESWFFPNCRINDESTFIAELNKAGFGIRHGQRIAPEKPGDPATYLAICFAKE